MDGMAAEYIREIRRKKVGKGRQNGKVREQHKKGKLGT
jgi:hypothetical protein